VRKVLLLNPPGDRLYIRDQFCSHVSKGTYYWQPQDLLMLSARSEHVHNKIKPALAEGKVVLCDRFADSSLAYQGYGRGEDLPQLNAMNRYATFGLVPDLTLICDVDVEEGLRRAKSDRPGLDRIELAGLDFHKAVREGFLELARTEPDRVKVIDAGQAPDDVFEDILAVVTEKIRDTIRPDF